MRPMPTPSSFYPRIFTLVVAAALGYALILIFAPFIGPMTWAAFLAFLLYPLNQRLRRRLSGGGIAAGVLTLLAPIVILLAPERAIDRFRRANFDADAEAAEIGGGTRYQVAVGSAAIPVDCRITSGWRRTRVFLQSKFNRGWSPPRAKR